jgi:hypothetical protein
MAKNKWTNAKYDSKTGMWTFIVVVGGVVEYVFGPSLSQIITYLATVLGIK